MTLTAILATCVCTLLLLLQVAYQVLLQKHRVNNVAEFLLRWERRQVDAEDARLHAEHPPVQVIP